MRSFVVEPMQHERLFLAGDAAHIVPPTGAKGLNTAMADVYLLAHALEAFYGGDASGLAAYSVARAGARLARPALLLVDDVDAAPLRGRRRLPDALQHSQLRYTASSRAQATALAENYVGMPFITA